MLFSIKCHRSFSVVFLQISNHLCYTCISHFK